MSRFKPSKVVHIRVQVGGTLGRCLIWNQSQEVFQSSISANLPYFASTVLWVYWYGAYFNAHYMNLGPCVFIGALLHPLQKVSFYLSLKKLLSRLVFRIVSDLGVHVSLNTMAKVCDHESMRAFETHLKAEPLKID